MKRTLKYSFITLMFLMLVLVRAFEAELFYDPLIEYFQNDYLYTSPPEIDSWKLLLDMLLRYLMNSIVSLMIIYGLFKKLSYVKFAGLIYIIAFTLFITVFGMLLISNFEQGYLLPFYIRRFIVHPLLLLIFLPAFYYHQKTRN